MPRLPVREKCSEDGCDRPHAAKGLCQIHYHRAMYVPRPRKGPLTAEDVVEMRQLRQKTGCTFRELAEIFGVSSATVSNVITRKTWKNVG